jgi:hypothetical protein
MAAEVKVVMGEVKQEPINVVLTGEFEVVVLFQLWRIVKKSNQEKGERVLVDIPSRISVKELEAMPSAIKSKRDSGYRTLMEILGSMNLHYEVLSEMQGLLDWGQSHPENEIFRSSLFGIESLTYSFSPLEGRVPTLEFTLKLPLAVLRAGVGGALGPSGNLANSSLGLLPFIGDTVWVGVYMPVKTPNSDSYSYDLVFESEFFIASFPILNFEGTTLISVNYRAIGIPYHSKSLFQGPEERVLKGESRTIDFIIEVGTRSGGSRNGESNVNKITVNKDERLINVIEKVLTNCLLAGFSKNLSKEELEFVITVRDGGGSSSLAQKFGDFLGKELSEIKVVPKKDKKGKDKKGKDKKEGGDGNPRTVWGFTIDQISEVEEDKLNVKVLDINDLSLKGVIVDDLSKRMEMAVDYIRQIVGFFMKNQGDEVLRNYTFYVVPPSGKGKKNASGDNLILDFEVVFVSKDKMTNSSTAEFKKMKEKAKIIFSFDLSLDVEKFLGQPRNVPVYPISGFTAGDFFNFVWLQHYQGYIPGLDTEIEDSFPLYVKNRFYLPLLGVRIETYLAPFVNLFDFVVFDTVNFPYVGMGGMVLGIEHRFWGGSVGTTLTIVSYYNFLEFERNIGEHSQA